MAATSMNSHGNVTVAAARAERGGYYATAFMGAFLALAMLLKHIPRMLPPGPYWSGWFSEGLIIDPIVAPLAISYEGEGLNVDGDRVAAAVGVALKVDKVVIMTNVPGLLRDKVITLIKGLPKALRRNFVPVPDFADRALAGMVASDTPLVQALVLTAIVIAFGMTAFVVVLILRSFLEVGTDHVDGVEPGDTIEMHWVHTSCDIEPGPGLPRLIRQRLMIEQGPRAGILQNESEIIESVMKIFFLWFTMDGAAQTSLAGRLSP